MSRNIDEVISVIIPEGKKQIKKTDFVGSAFFNVMAMYFLSHKHDNICVILNEPYKKDENKKINWLGKLNSHDNTHIHKDSCVLLPEKLYDIPEDQTAVSLRWIQNKTNSYISVPKPENKFWKKFTNCSSKRYVVLPFGYNCSDNSGHANYLLYDKLEKTLERIEPYGFVNTKCLNSIDLDLKIKQLFERNLGKEFIKKYIKPTEFLPRRAFQSIQEDEKEMTKDDPVGFCSIWSMWYIDLRLSNPGIDRKILVKFAMKKLKSLPISFTQFIRNYAHWIFEISTEIKKLYKQK